MARGGSIAPERYIHTDGGVYRGIWRGGQKEGLGTYTYPSGARYQGQWENNLKHGLGIYTFPKVRSTCHFLWQGEGSSAPSDMASCSLFPGSISRVWI